MRRLLLVAFACNNTADLGNHHDGGPVAENTADACRDGVDNDGDGHVDCADQDCEEFVFCAHGGESEAESESEGEVAHDAGAEPDGGGGGSEAEAESESESESEGARCTPVVGPDTWTAAAAPTGVYGATAVWTGSEIVLWGGDPGTCSDNGGLPYRGGRYNPATDSWSTVSADPPISNRRSHTMLWTGSEVLIWGGVGLSSGGSGCTDLATGLRYNPTTDTFRSMPTLGAPLWNNEPGVWTGSEMLVWGTSPDGGGRAMLAEGSRYDPSAGAWGAMESLGSPSARQNFTVAWTGSELFVWGGLVSTGSPETDANDGGWYNPATDRWRPGPTTDGAPSPRENARASWTGSKMIVLGGLDGGRQTNSGSRYDPTTDSWAATTTSGPAPSAYGGIGIVAWTGSEMIAWQGASLPGSKYDPARNVWTAMSTTGVTADANGPAVWTGCEFIVLGRAPARYAP